MNAASVKFLLLSLCFHFALLWLFGQKGNAESGVAPGSPGISSTSSVLTARLVPDEYAAALPPPAIAATDLRLIPEWPMAVKAAGPRAEFTSGEGAGREYVIAGRLTRLPEPISEIDLNVPGINDSDITGKVELTILVDRDGNVVDAIPVVENDSARAFAERVAQRFRIARFKPGEINGKTVKAQLRITVVSESLSASDPGVDVHRGRVREK